jgi:magnesium-transporting ATPase (P-type)
MLTFDSVAILLVVSAAFAFMNAKLLRLPTEIGVLIMGLAASLLLNVLELVTKQTEVNRRLKRYGPNTIASRRRISAFRVLSREFQSTVVYLLSAASALAFYFQE